MPAPLVAGFGKFIAAQLNVIVWDGEVQRYDPQGRPVNPQAPVSPGPARWPVVVVKMTEAGFQRNWTTEDAYDDEGELLVECWGTSRTQLETKPAVAAAPGLTDQVEQLLSAAANWSQITLGGPSANPYYVVACLLQRWTVVQLENERSARGELLYKGDQYYQVRVHGAVATT